MGRKGYQGVIEWLFWHDRTKLSKLFVELPCSFLSVQCASMFVCILPLFESNSLEYSTIIQSLFSYILSVPVSISLFFICP